MAYRQVVNFDLSKMGTRPGWCEKNVREGYGLPARCKDAKADMEFNKAQGALHPMDTLPTNVDVPVFCDTPSPNEHIEASVKGVLYSDGARVVDPGRQKYFGWGEFCATARVVEFVPDPVPPTPTPTDFNVGDKVTLKNWVDYNGTPLKQTRDFYFIKQINGDRAVLTADSVDGPVYAAVNTNNLTKVDGGGIHVGSRVTLNNWVDYNGTPLKKTRDFYFVSQLNGDRAVLNADSINGPVYAAVNVNNLREV